jgi:superkiller protein 3
MTISTQHCSTSNEEENTLINICLQALVAESMKHEDAMDLFRHTTQLGIHLESCIGYSHWVCSTLMTLNNENDPHYVYSIEKMFAVPVAGDAMVWYTGRIIMKCLVSLET